MVSKILEFKNLPKHIAIIMDGNGRWAKKKLMPRIHGHKAGADNFKAIVKYCNKIKISHLTFFAFSTENWKRPKKEIEFLMKLFKIYLKEALSKFKEENIKVVFLGDKKYLPKKLVELMEEVEEVSSNHTGMTLNIALNYGSKKEIVMATKIIAEKIKNNKLSIECINENLISDHLYTKNQPDVDLLIRTGAEKRISNFLLWQSAYAEFIFTKKFWPDFDYNELNKALKEFSLRNRRFGGGVMYN